MIVLSVPQPWASLMVTRHPYRPINLGINHALIRKWKPDAGTLQSMQTEGILIHAISKWGKEQRESMLKWPFNKYLKELQNMPFGAFLGTVKLIRYVTAKAWIQDANLSIMKEGPHYAEPDSCTLDDEQYELLRFEWLEHFLYELSDPVKFSKPIYIKGATGRLWNYPTEKLANLSTL